MVGYDSWLITLCVSGSKQCPVIGHMHAANQTQIHQVAKRGVENLKNKVRPLKSGIREPISHQSSLTDKKSGKNGGSNRS
jgi:hypothetical protein